MPKKLTIFQRLNKVFSQGRPYKPNEYNANSYGMSSDIIFKTKDKEKYDQLKLQKQQQSLLARQWVKAKYDIQNNSLAGLNNVKLMLRDADMMDAFPEIGAALDLVSEECVPLNDEGNVLNITSSSDRIKSILQDLFINRLMVNTTLPMICRATCKYGNQYMLLNLDEQNGILGWKQLPVYDMERYENGQNNPYSAAYTSLAAIDPDQDMSTKFVWVGENNYIPYRNWQIAHFRLLYDNMFLPYGVSFLQKARRHFRMLSMMEDMMLIYRLERSVERRVFKINVGAIDEKDVPAYVQEIANNFKRTPIIDPETGQIDLRKNILPVWRKTPIPLLDGRTITIEELAKEFEEGKTNYVYSIQDKSLKVVPGKVVWCGKNYTADKMVKVTLDDGSYMVMAPEHPIVMRDGTKKRADKVQKGESVMPFYREIKEGKESIYNPQTGRYEQFEQLMNSFINKNNPWFIPISYLGFNNNLYTENIDINIDTDGINHITNLSYYSSNENCNSKKMGVDNLEKDKKLAFIPNLINIKKNHKIADIEYVTGDDVYCMTVQGENGEEDRHNFALRTFKEDGTYNESGCFVSNCNMDDFFIPVRDDNAQSPIEVLPAAQNLSAMDDIKFVQNKVFTALRVPKAFLNFEEAQGDGKNLSLLDVRFTRTVNRIQQAMILELNKVAMIHLYLLGFTDELTNFNITMNNPSSQAELLELDSMAKKVTTAKDAISDAGNGIPLMSVSNAWRRILKWSDKEIQDNLEELRLESALAAELQQTAQIIKRTRIFDPVDNIYGEPGADYGAQQQGGPDAGGPGGPGGGAPGGGGGPDIGGAGLDFGDSGAPDASGAEGDMGMDQAAADNGAAPGGDAGAPPAGGPGGAPEPPQENLLTRKGKKMLSEMMEVNRRRKEKVLHEMQEKSKHYSELLMNKIRESRKKPKETMCEDYHELDKLTNKTFLVNEELDDVSKQLKEYVDKSRKKNI